MRYLLFLLSLLICGGIGYAVYQQSIQDEGKEKEKKGGRTMAVEVVEINKSDIEDRIELVGGLEPKAQVTIRSRARGYITRLPFDVGDFIGEDGTLPVIVELDDRAARELLNGAEAALRVVEAQEESKTAQLLLAEKMLERSQGLAGTAATSQQELERAEAQVKIADAEVSLEKAQVAQAKSEVERFRIQLSDTKIKAPIAGYVAQRFVDVGDLANPDDPLIHIVDLSVVRTIVHVVEKDYEKVKVGQLVDVTIDAFASESIQGTVIRRAPVLDTETRTGAVQIEIPNPQGRLKPGMHARVSIVTERREKVPVAPLTALLEHTASPSIFVVTGSPEKVELRAVRVGIYSKNHVEILEGLQDGERVVTLGSHMIKDGQEVTTVLVESTAKPGVKAGLRGD